MILAVAAPQVRNDDDRRSEENQGGPVKTLEVLFPALAMPVGAAHACSTACYAVTASCIRKRGFGGDLESIDIKSSVN